MRNLHRIMGATFQHAKPGLCHECAHRRDCGEWEGYCIVRNKILSAPKSSVKFGRCCDFKRPSCAKCNDTGGYKCPDAPGGIKMCDCKAGHDWAYHAMTGQ